MALASVLDEEGFEIACEDARRRRLTSMPGLQSYLDSYGRAGRSGVGEIRRLLRVLDPTQASRSTLEVKTRRLLVEHGVRHFVREFPLDWKGRTYRYDFGRDNEKWSVPGRHRYRLVLATWTKVTKRPDDLMAELSVTLGM